MLGIFAMVKIILACFFLLISISLLLLKRYKLSLQVLKIILFCMTLLQYIRNITGCSVDKFKSKWGKYIATMPDQPPLPGYTSHCRAPTNSLPDQANLQFRDARSGSSFEDSTSKPHQVSRTK